MKSKKHILFLLAAIVVAMILAPGCSSISVNQDYDTSFDFSNWKTFGFIPIPESAGIDQLSADKISNAIKTQLNAKGFKDSEPADFGVALHFGQQTVTDVQSYGYGWWGGGVDVSQYQQGTLVIDLIDMKTNKLEWRGTAEGAMSDNPDVQERTANIDSAVAQMLAPFPPDMMKK
jgi:hypothetical protein